MYIQFQSPTKELQHPVDNFWHSCIALPKAPPPPPPLAFLYSFTCMVVIHPDMVVIHPDMVVIHPDTWSSSLTQAPHRQTGRLCLLCAGLHQSLPQDRTDLRRQRSLHHQAHPPGDRPCRRTEEKVSGLLFCLGLHSLSLAAQEC